MTSPHNFDEDRRDNVTISQIRALLAFATERSVSGAARRLGREQSTVSRQLSHLDAAFSFPLSRRKGKETIPTNRATHLAARLEKLLKEVELFVEQNRDDSVWVRIGAGASPVHSLIVPNLARIREIFSTPPTGPESVRASLRQCRLSIANIRSHETVARLRDGRLDFGIVREGELDSIGDLARVHLGNVGYQLIMSRSLATEKNARTLEQVAREQIPVVTLSGRGEFKRELLVRLEEAQLKLNLQDDMDFFADVVTAVRWNPVAGIVPTLALIREPDRQDFVAIHLKIFAEDNEKRRSTYDRSFCLAWHPQLLKSRGFPNDCETQIAQLFRATLAEASSFPSTESPM